MIKKLGAEPANAAVPRDPHRHRGIAPALFVAAASALLGAAIAAFLLWPAAVPPSSPAARSDPVGARIATSANDLRLISLRPTVPGNRADQPNPSLGLADIAAELPRGPALLLASRGTAPVHLAKAAAGVQPEPSAQEAKPLSAPNVAVAAAPAPNVAATAAPAPSDPPYPRDAGKSVERNSFTGRYRVEEDKFLEVPCTATRIASSVGGKCLLGYRGLGCNRAIDVVMYNVGSLSIEASTLIFDPYKLAATGFATRCNVASQPAYGQEDFQDMNQVTRRGGNWHSFSSNGEDKSIEFSDGRHNCLAVHKPGPKWQGGYIYMLHASICRTDTASVRPEDVASALSLLQIRQDDPVANLRTAGR